MKQTFFFSFLSSLVLSGAMLCGCQSTDTDEPVVPGQRTDIWLSRSEQAIVNNHNDFSLKLFNQISGETDKSANIALAPLSASMALSMLANGAAGETQSEIIDVIGMNGFDLDHVNKLNMRIASEYPAADNTSKFSLANSLWFSEKAGVRNSFVTLQQDTYGAEMFNHSFAPEVLQNEMNKWVSNKTFGMIPQFFKDPVNAPIVIVNATYFKGLWASPFEKSNTKPATFTCASGSQTQVDMMYNKGSYSYVRDTDGAYLVTLPYGNGAFDMLLVLPDKDVDLDGYMRGLSASKLDDSRYYLSNGKRPAEVELPKFSLSFDTDLANSLYWLGIKSAFDREVADFSPMTDNKSFNIGMVLHAVEIKVDEAGTKAAAATGILVDGGFVGPTESVEAPKFVFDRPFAFMIRETSTNTIMFIGQVNEL